MPDQPSAPELLVTFEPDAAVAADATTFAADCVAWAQLTFNRALDFTDVPSRGV